MGTFAAMLVPYFKSQEGFDDGNKSIDLPFQSRKVIECFHLPLLIVFFCSKKPFYNVHSYLHLVAEINFTHDF